MARKKKEKRLDSEVVESTEKQDGTEIEVEKEPGIEDLKTEEPVEFVEEKIKEQKPSPKKEADHPVKKKELKDIEPHMTIEDASRRFVIGFKEQWLPSIKAFCEKQYNLSGKIPESQCKSILKAWGAKIK